MSLTFNDFSIRRFKRLLREHIERFELDLSGLIIFTEAASGYYMLTPAMCQMAGAKHVHALARTSRYGTADEVISASRKLMAELDCGKNITFHFTKNVKALGESDIIMNAGAVRPIDEYIVGLLKPTAVVPLMWETWEFRPEELDIKACKARGILVMGTDEIELDRFPFAGYLPLKLLFQSDVEVFKSKLLLIGSGRSGTGMATVFHKNGFDFKWVNFDSNLPSELKKYQIDYRDKGSLLKYISQVDAVVCFEHLHNRPVIAQDGIFSPQEMHAANDSLVLVHVSGVIDFDEIMKQGVRIHPGVRVPFGTMSIGTWEMGPRSIIELTMAGIKVGEAMARARLSGMTISESASWAMEHSLAQDFPDDLSWVK